MKSKAAIYPRIRIQFLFETLKIWNRFFRKFRTYYAIIIILLINEFLLINVEQIMNVSRFTNERNLKNCLCLAASS